MKEEEEDTMGSNNTFFLLPLTEQMNPLDPTTAEFGQDWLAGSVAYVLSKPERTRPTRVAISSGMLTDVTLGTVHVARHDQTHDLLGRYSVVGIVYYDDTGEVAATEGDVPNRKLAAAVFK